MKNIKNLLSIATTYKKPIGVFFALLVVIFTYKYFAIPPTSTIQDEKIVEVEIVKNSTIKEMANFIGTIRSRQQTALTAKTNGILAITSTPGQLIKKGELIAKIDNEEIERNFPKMVCSIVSLLKENNRLGT